MPKKNKQEITANNSEITEGSYEIPKVMRFIWVGGLKRLNTSEWKNIFEWAVKNPEWKINILVDRKSDPKKPDLIEEYKEIIQKHFQNDNKKIEQFAILDIAELGLRDKYVTYELDKLIPNYGAASDLIRYDLLEREGGSYFDIDVLPSRKPQKNKKTQAPKIQSENSKTEKQLTYKSRNLNYILTGRKHHTLFLDHQSQYSSETKGIGNELKEFRIAKIGNDTLITTKNNPLMLEIKSESRKSYLYENNKEKLIQNAYGSKDIKKVTMERTGPGLIVSLIADKTKINKKLDKRIYTDKFGKKVIIKRMRDEKISLCEPAKINSESWLINNRIVPKNTLEEALSSIKNTIEFEIEHFHILRADDHLNDLFACLPPSLRKDTNNIIQSFLNICEASIKERDKIEIVQCTGLYKETLSYFSEKSYKTFFDLDVASQKRALDCLLIPEFLNFIDNLENDLIDPDREKSFLNKRLGYIDFLKEKIKFVNALLEQEISSALFPELKTNMESYHKFITFLMKNGKNYDTLSELQNTTEKIIKYLETKITEDTIDVELLNLSGPSTCNIV